jgi:molybdopterin molybdotransferase
MTDGLISVEEALARVLASARQPLGEESVALGDALGRTLAREVRSQRAQPPFASSAMDGYALRAADAAHPGARLAAVGVSAAGHAFAGSVAASRAARIFTGAPMPDGADAVVMQEEARREGDWIALQTTVSPGDYVRPRGCDFEAGEAMLAAGRRLTPRDVALAAAADCASLVVRRRPRVAILTAGDELVAPGAARGLAQVVASNAPNALAASLARAREAKADVLATLGGASVGDRDLVRQALAEAGMELDFWRIAMRPGKPMIHGRLGATTVLGLPGNPASSMVCALLFLRPLLRALVGDPEAGADPSEPARLAVALGPNGARRTYLRAALTRAGDGALLARPAPSQDSSLIKTLARADALIVRPPDAPPAEAGDLCRVIRFAALGA